MLTLHPLAQEVGPAFDSRRGHEVEDASIPWKDMAGYGMRLIHDYEKVDVELLLQPPRP